MDIDKNRVAQRNVGGSQQSEGNPHASAPEARAPKYSSAAPTGVNASG